MKTKHFHFIKGTILVFSLFFILTIQLSSAIAWSNPVKNPNFSSGCSNNNFTYWIESGDVKCVTDGSSAASFVTGSISQNLQYIDTDKVGEFKFQAKGVIVSYGISGSVQVDFFYSDGSSKSKCFTIGNSNWITLRQVSGQYLLPPNKYISKIEFRNCDVNPLTQLEIRIDNILLRYYDDGGTPN